MMGFPWNYKVKYNYLNRYERRKESATTITGDQSIEIT